MNKTEKKDVIFIRARLRGGDYVNDGISASGYRVLIPYRDYNLLLRCIRELWFRLHFPYKKIWFNPKIKKINAKNIIIKDPLITPDFIEWIKKEHPDSKVVLDYDNPVCRSINPDAVPSGIEMWSYDPEDCKKYNMNLKPRAYLDIYQIRKKEPYFDVLFLGRDKGRADYLLELQRKLESCGLKTFFYIAPDRSFLKFKRSFYKKSMPYTKYLDLLSHSRAVLNIMPSGRYGITQREMEAVFDGVKCITNNVGILDFELYDKSRYYLLDPSNIDIDSITKFLSSDFVEVDNSTLNGFRFDRYVEKVVGYN